MSKVIAKDDPSGAGNNIIVKPFEVLNLGKYQKAKLKENGISRYIDFILKLYCADPVSGYITLHGKKAGRIVHIGDVDSIVTEREI